MWSLHVNCWVPMNRIWFSSWMYKGARLKKKVELIFKRIYIKLFIPVYDSKEFSEALKIFHWVNQGLKIITTYFWPVFWLAWRDQANVVHYEHLYIEVQSNLFQWCRVCRKPAPLDVARQLFSEIKLNRISISSPWIH